VKKEEGEKENVRSRATKELTLWKKRISVGTKIEEAEMRYEKQERDSRKDRIRSGQQKSLNCSSIGWNIDSPPKLDTIVKLTR